MIGLFAAAEYAQMHPHVPFLHAVQLYDLPTEAPHLPWWRVAHAIEYKQLRDIFAQYAVACANQPVGGLPAALLVDAHCPQVAGGSGKKVDWEMLARARQGAPDTLPPLVLAGGLNPENVADAIRVTRCRAVDAASGVETPGNPGKKDRQRMRDFVAAAQAAFIGLG